LYLARRLAEYAHSLKFEDLGPETVLEAKKRIIDALGCAIGAFDEPPIAMARNGARRLVPKGTSTLLGTSRTSSPDMATFVNGLMIRYFDFNDTYLSKEPAHPSDNLGQCLSVADSEHSTGKELILALVLGYEIQCRLCDAADIRHRGWDHVCYGLVSAALSSGKLMRLTIEELEQAVNIALNGHIAMRQVRAGELSMWKGASFSNAARNGVFAATMAREGMEGPSPIFEGEMGFFKQVSGPFDLDVNGFGGAVNRKDHEQEGGRKRGNFKLVETYIKFYPAEYHSQSAVAAALQIREEIPDPSRIASVLIETHEAGYTILGKDPEKWEPKTKETADHSLPYIVGMAILNGKIDNSTYSDPNIHDPLNLAFLKRITVREDKKLTELYPQQGIANRVTAKLDSGRTISREVVTPKGHPKNPMSNSEIEAKFARLTSRYIPSSRAEPVLKELRQLEKVKDISGLMPLLRVR
jgi:2-methylcitrate dehydratase